MSGIEYFELANAIVLSKFMPIVDGLGRMAELVLVGLCWIVDFVLLVIEVVVETGEALNLPVLLALASLISLSALILAGSISLNFLFLYASNN